MVGSIIGWFFACLGILLLLVLVLPTVVGMDYTGGVFTLWVRVLFVKLTLFPAKPKKRADEAAGTKEDKPKKEGGRHLFRKKKKTVTGPDGEEIEVKTEKKRSLEDILNLIKRIAAAAGTGMKWALRGICIRNVDLVFPVHGGDAAQVAIQTGRLQALVGGTRAVLDNLFKISYRRLVLIPDFTGQMAQNLHFSCKIAVVPVIMLVAGVVGLLRFAFWKKRNYTVQEYIQYKGENYGKR